jgi:CBS domain-containing protein
VESLPADLPYADLMGILGSTPHSGYPVVDDEALAGMISVRDARAALLDPAVDRNATTRAFMRPAVTLREDDDLGTAVERLSSAGVSEAVVVDPDGKPVGMVSREGILEAWRRATVPG